MVHNERDPDHNDSGDTHHAELDDMPELTLSMRLWPVFGSGDRTVS
jgi:hypothetical protein